VAFLYRVLLLYIDIYHFRLPQGGKDTENFDIWANAILQLNPHTFLETISNGVKLFSTMGACIYYLFGRNPEIWAGSMIFFGLGTIFYTYRTTLLLTGSKKLSRISAWIIALYPNIAVLSVLVLRESPIQLFSIMSIYYYSKYTTCKKKRWLVLFLFSALFATILHSAMIYLLVGFALCAVLINNSGWFQRLFSIFMATGVLYLVDHTGLGLSKFGGSFDGALSILEERRNPIDSGAKYPEWLLIKGELIDLARIPVRMIAFLFAPLIPFLVRTTKHALGLVDGLLYFFCLASLIKNFSRVYRIKLRKALVLITLAGLFVYSMGSSNFGTNIRHRTKFLPIIVVLTVSSMKIKQGSYERA